MGIGRRVTADDVKMGVGRKTRNVQAERAKRFASTGRGSAKDAEAHAQREHDKEYAKHNPKPKKGGKK